LIICREPSGFNLVGDGLSWVSAACLYIFAEYFGLHGWLASGIWTWIPFFVFGGISFYLASHDIFEVAAPRWHWAVLTFRMFIVRTRTGHYWFETGFYGHISPLSYFWAAAAL
jgi:hypothetical protein